jgi:hypothetical protein
MDATQTNKGANIMTTNYWDEATDEEIKEIHKDAMANFYNRPTYSEWLASGFADFFESTTEEEYYAKMMYGPVQA